MKITPNSGFPIFTIGDGILFSVDAPIEPEFRVRYDQAMAEFKAVQDILGEIFFKALRDVT